VRDPAKERAVREAVASVVDPGGRLSFAVAASTRQIPDFLVRLTSIWDRSLRSITISLGRRNRHTTEKARRVLGWAPRPAAETVLACANSLIEHKAI
jgi:hypothetical protein